MGLTEVDNAPAETQDELVVEESQDINDDNNVIKEVDEEQLVDDLYEEDILDIEDEEDPDVGQFSMLCFTDVDDKLNCDAHFASLTLLMTTMPLNWCWLKEPKNPSHKRK